MGSLVGKLVSSAIVYGRCRAFDQVADMKEPLDLLKVKGYRSSYKKDHTQASTILPPPPSLGWMSLWRFRQLLLKRYCQEALNSANTCSFKDSSPSAFFAKGYPILGS
nr:hypothetical protein [Tanacetum cinerariifolium]